MLHASIVGQVAGIYSESDKVLPLTMTIVGFCLYYSTGLPKGHVDLVAFPDGDSGPRDLPRTCCLDFRGEELLLVCWLDIPAPAPQSPRTTETEPHTSRTLEPRIVPESGMFGRTCFLRVPASPRGSTGTSGTPILFPQQAWAAQRAG